MSLDRIRPGIDDEDRPDSTIQVATCPGCAAAFDLDTTDRIRWAADCGLCVDCLGAEGRRRLARARVLLGADPAGERILAALLHGIDASVMADILADYERDRRGASHAEMMARALRPVRAVPPLTVEQHIAGVEEAQRQVRAELHSLQEALALAEAQGALPVVR